MVDEEIKKTGEEGVDDKEEEEENSSSIETIDQANDAADRMKRENDRREEIVKAETKLAVQAQLAGKANAGRKQEKKKETTPEEYANEMMEGKVELFKDV